MGEIICSKIDEFGDEYLQKKVILKLSANSYNKGCLKHIEKDILEVLRDKAFDGIAWFEEIG